jgi:ketosteroid isomerase-like protein
MGEEEEHIALRVEPLDMQCRELNEKYMAPVSYNMNNMFITDWDEDDFANLDFYDIFERFYEETYGKNCPYTMSDDLSVGNEYDIPADEFENVIMQHFKVSPEELHTLLRYDTDKNIYTYRPRGFDEFDYVEVPYPEVTAFETNDDGSLTLTVNAVFPNDNTSKLFSHKVTVAEENGKIYYRSNEILGDEEINLWWHADRLSDEEWNENYKGGVDAADDYSWMIPQADHENFTEEEKKQIEEDTLRNVTKVWEFINQPRISVLEALGQLGVIATTDGANTQNGEKFNPFYDDYLSGKSGMVTIFKVYDDGVIGSITFLNRDEEIQSYYVGVKPGANGEPCISEKSVQEIASVKYTPKGYFIYEYKDPMLHAGSHGYFRLSPMSDECRSLTDRFLKYLDFQKYKLMVCDWDEKTVNELLMPGMFEDFYYIKYSEAYRDSFDSIPADLFEEVMTTYLPVTVSDLRKAYEYNETSGTYSQETVYNSPYPPFLEVTDYKYNADGTITLYADGVWPDYDSDHAFTNEIVVKPFKDGTFRILSNDVTEQELKLPPVAYTK